MSNVTGHDDPHRETEVASRALAIRAATQGPRDTDPGAAGERPTRPSKLVRKHGSFKRLAAAIGMSIHGLMKARTPSRPQSPRLAIIVARVAECSVDEILTAKWPPPIACPRCKGCGTVPA